MVREAHLGPKTLAEMISHLVADNKEQLRNMQEAMRCSKSDARQRDLCSLVCEVAGIQVR